MVPSRTEESPAWTKTSRTVFAYSSGRMPNSASQVAWQPFAGAGSVPAPRTMTKSMRSLHQRIVRGEA